MSLDDTCSYLMTQASAATVDHDTHLSLVVYAHFSGSVFVINIIHNLNFGIMVSCSQSPQLSNKTGDFS